MARKNKANTEAEEPKAEEPKAEEPKAEEPKAPKLKRFRLKNVVRLPIRGKIKCLKIGHVLNEGPLIDDVKRYGGKFEEVI